MQDNGAERRTRAALACLDRTPENFWERNDAQFELDKYEEFFKILARGPHTVPPRRVEEAKQRRKQARTRKARDLLADAQSATSLERQAYYINAFCALVAGGEHTIADREGQEAKAILKLRATKEAKGWLAEVRSQFLVAQSNNFAGAQSKKSATREALNKVLANAWSLQECVGYGADVPSNDFEDARIALAMALFALQRYDEALAEATAFTTKCPEHKRPMPWMIQAHILNGSKKDAAHKAYLVARARHDALEPHERKGEMIGKKFTINTLAELFPRPQSSRPAKRQRAASSSGGGGDGGGDGGSAPLTAKVCGAELEISSAFICTRVDSMKARIAAKRKRLEEGSLTEKQLIFYGEEWAEECIGSWSDDHVDEVQLRDLWIRQGGLCALSGQLMSTRINDPNVGSVDRKDSRRGYTADNVQWVCAWANYMKSSMPEGLFFQRCMTLGSRYTEWSLQKMADMEEQLLERKRETGEQPDEAEEQEGKGKEKMDSH